jgi:hypothetical protein
MCENDGCKKALKCVTKERKKEEKKKYVFHLGLQNNK